MTFLTASVILWVNRSIVVGDVFCFFFFFLDCLRAQQFCSPCLFVRHFCNAQRQTKGCTATKSCCKPCQLAHTCLQPSSLCTSCAHSTRPRQSPAIHQPVPHPSTGECLRLCVCYFNSNFNEAQNR